MLNTGLIKYRVVFIIAEQGLHRAKAFSAVCTATLVRELVVHERLGSDIRGTGDLN